MSGKVLQWCQFPSKAVGGFGWWHLVSREDGYYRAACGRLLTAPPLQCIDEKPNELRGICRSCERLAFPRRRVAQ